VAEVLGATGSLIRTVETLNGSERGLRPLDACVSDWLEHLVTDGAILDPERPVDAETLLALFAPGPAPRGGRWAWLWISTAAVAAGAAVLFY
jgi:hypothetical protein